MSHYGTNGTRTTNNVYNLQGVPVSARIDPNLTADDIVKQLCVKYYQHFNVSGPPSDYALRDESGELVTNENLREKILRRVDLRSVVVPLPEP